jgi:UDP-glucose 4-epimerase
MKRIAVTGAGGFIGSHLMRATGEFDIRPLRVRSSSVNSLELSGIDCLVHLAGVSRAADPKEYFAVNAELAETVAMKARAEGVRHFVYMSSAKVYGSSSPAGTVWNEDAACNPDDAYGHSKFQAECRLKSLVNSKFTVAIIRPSVVYGPGGRGNILRLIRLIDRAGIVPLGGITNTRSMVYIENLIAVLHRVIRKEAAGIFLATDAQQLSTTELARLISRLLLRNTRLCTIPRGLVAFARACSRTSIDRLWGSFALDDTQTAAALSLHDKHSIEAGMAATIAWYRGREGAR